MTKKWPSDILAGKPNFFREKLGFLEKKQNFLLKFQQNLYKFDLGFLVFFYWPIQVFLIFQSGNAGSLSPALSFILQQGGAPAHTARLTQDCLKTNCTDFIALDEWPQTSPDLNPLDYHVWGAMLEAYHKLQPQPKPFLR